jgi:dihydrofolate synthase/folylpolyglutamate synthase
MLSLISNENSLEKRSKQNILNQMKNNFERMKFFLKFLNNPQYDYKSIHIAGTSGKGSVAVMLEKLLYKSNLKVGKYIKPYLQIPLEKISINTKMISPMHFSKIVSEVETDYNQFLNKYPTLKPNYAEVWFSLAHLLFKQEKVDFGIIEAGVGGRFDPSNILSPVISIITSIGFDHEHLLGSTLKSIAWHKAGIIKEGIPLIVGYCHHSPLEVIKKEAHKKNAQIYLLGKNIKVDIKSSNSKGTIFDFKSSLGNFNHIYLPLLGEFQAYNFSLALFAYLLLQKKYKFKSPKNINLAIRNIKFPGRMEVVQKKPTVILDGAHNQQKMKFLIKDINRNYQNVSSMNLIIGMVESKNAVNIIKEIKNIFKTIIITEPKVYGKNPYPTLAIKKIIKNFCTAENIIIIPDPVMAVKYAIKNNRKNDLILVTGSLYLIGNVRSIWYPIEKILSDKNKFY